MPSMREKEIVLPKSKADGLVANMKSRLAVIVTHPWGPLGGNMHNNVVTAAALYFQELQITTLRFNFSGLQIGRGHQQVEQMKEAADYLLGELPEPRPTNLLLVGYSYGSLISASSSANIRSCIGVVSIAPPFAVQHWLLMFNSNYHLEQAKKVIELPRLYVIGNLDNFTSEKVFLKTVETFPQESTTGAVLAGADHFFFKREKDVLNVIGQWLIREFPKCDRDLRQLKSIDFE